MTTRDSLLGLIEVAADLSEGLSTDERYRRLLAVAHRLIPFDSAAILKLENDVLRPVAAIGLDNEVLGRRFKVSEHPRLQTLIDSGSTVIFPPDSDLPDPYDGLVDHAGPHLDVHSCMGNRLVVHDRTWGVITFDALEPGVFDTVDPVITEAFATLAAAAAATGSYIDELESRFAQSAELVDNLSHTQYGSGEIIGNSKVMQSLLSEIRIVARSGFTVLITGETGTGKELVAQEVHRLSDRADRPLVQINCAALPDTLAESELFGHRRGAFTGATGDRAGKFALADGGTLFLDEIGELPLQLQAKLLRALQSGEIQRVGDDSIKRVDVRVIAATNRDLAEEVQKGRFRADLYQRLSVYPVDVPPLRLRLDDISLLSGYFLERLARELGKPQMRLTTQALNQLEQYNWPGNIRELQHVLSRAALRAEGEKGSRAIMIDVGGIDVDTTRALPKQAQERAEITGTLAEMTASFQRQLVNSSLLKNGGNRAATARSLGLDRSNLHRLMKRLDIDV